MLFRSVVIIILTIQYFLSFSQIGYHNNINQLSKSVDTDTILSTSIDDPQSRAEYLKILLSNPNTGLIPQDIRIKELQFSDKLTEYSASKRIKASTWKYRGPNNLGGRTRAIGVDVMNENVIIAGGVSGGLWRSEDFGVSWEKVSSDIPNVTTVIQDTREGYTHIWYYGTGELVRNSASGGGAPFIGNGLFKSEDNGKSWKPLESTNSNTPGLLDSDFDYCHSLKVDPVSGHLYAATFGGIKRSMDFGETFHEVIDGDSCLFTDIAIDANGNKYAFLSNNELNQGLFRSEDGDEWVNITPLAYPKTHRKTDISISGENDSIIYLFSEAPGFSALDHSLFRMTVYQDSAGQLVISYEDRSENIPSFGGAVGDYDSQQSYDLFIEVSPMDEDIVFLGGTNLYRSTDGFSTPNNTVWVGGYSLSNDLSKYSQHHPDQHALVFLASDPRKMISSHDGGISFTEDNLKNEPDGTPVNWRSLNNGYQTSQANTIAIDAQNTSDNKVIVGFQDNGTWFTQSDTVSTPFLEIISGDGSFCSFANDGFVRYVSSQTGFIFRLNYSDPENNFFESFTNATPSLATGFLFINPFLLDKVDDRIMYLPAGKHLWKNTNLNEIPIFSNNKTSVNWRRIDSSEIPSGKISALDVSKQQKGLVYYGTTKGMVYKINIQDSDLEVAQPENLTDTDVLPVGYVSCIEIDDRNPQTVTVVYSNYGIPSIFHSFDGGQTWQDVEGNLASLETEGPSFRWVESLHYQGARRFYLGTSIGLFSTDSMRGENTVWIKEGDGSIGNAVVTMVKARADGLVTVATHGNGVYMTMLNKDMPPKSPTDLRAIGLSQESIELLWRDNSNNEDKFIVSFKTSNSNDLYGTIDIPANETSVTIDGLVQNTEYQFEVNAVNSNGESNDNASASFITLPFIPEPPSALNISDTLRSSVILRWKDNSMVEEGFDVERSFLLNGLFSRIATLGQNDTVFNDNTLIPGFDYVYRIRAFNEFGQSYSNTLTLIGKEVFGIDPSDENKVRIYPVPADNTLNLNILEDSRVIFVRLYDASGRVIKEYNVQREIENNQTTLDISSLKHGLYLVEIFFNDSRVLKRLFKN